MGGGLTAEHRRHLQDLLTRRVLQPNPEPWIAADANDPLSEEVPSNYCSTGSLDEEGDTLTINDVRSLRNGIIRTSKNKVQAPYTILLVGEAGVGKSALLQFLANVLLGNDIDHLDYNILDSTNEQGGSDNQSQTNSPRLYENTSTNGIAVRILDTPGLADTRGIEHDEHHKKNIAAEIQKHIDSVNAIFILANGTIPYVTAGTEYAFSTLSSIFPKSLADNIAFVFTNVASPLSRNFSEKTIPEVFQHAARFSLNNPIAIQKKFLSIRSDPKQRKTSARLRASVRTCEEDALQELVELFDWLDGLEPQPTKKIVDLYYLSQTIEAVITNILAQLDQVKAKKVEVDELTRALKDTTYDMNVIRNIENTMTVAGWSLQESLTINMVCGQANCYSNCDIDYESNNPLDLNGRFRSSCDKCNHDVWNHHRCRVIWWPVIDRQVLIDDNVKQKWESAKDGKEKVAVLIKLHANVLGAIIQVFNNATSELAPLLERYARLSLAGGLSVQKDNTVKLLKQRYAALERKYVDQDQIQKANVRLGQVKRKLELLNIVEDERKESTGTLSSKIKKWYQL